jgi:hypothetical protein
MYCQSKVRQKYEFGNKVGLAVTSKGSRIVRTIILTGNPCAGLTLGKQLEGVRTLLGEGGLKQVFVDRGYRGHKHEGGEAVYVGRKRPDPEKSVAVCKMQGCDKTNDWAHEKRPTLGAKPSQRPPRQCGHCAPKRRGDETGKAAQVVRAALARFFWSPNNSFSDARRAAFMQLSHFRPG